MNGSNQGFADSTTALEFIEFEKIEFESQKCCAFRSASTCTSKTFENLGRNHGPLGHLISIFTVQDFITCIGPVQPFLVTHSLPSQLLQHAGLSFR